MPIALLLAFAPLPVPQASPPPAAVSAWSGYLRCLRAQSARWLNDAAPAAHLEAVMAACEPQVAPAANEIADSVKASVVFPTIAATYKRRHGTDIVIAPAIETLVRDAGRHGAVRLLAGEADPQAAVEVTFSPDGVVVPASPAPAGDRPAAPASGSR